MSDHVCNEDGEYIEGCPACEAAMRESMRDALGGYYPGITAAQDLERRLGRPATRADLIQGEGGA